MLPFHLLPFNHNYREDNWQLWTCAEPRLTSSQGLLGHNDRFMNDVNVGPLLTSQTGSKRRLQSITSHVYFAVIDRAKSSPRPTRVWNAAFVSPWRKWRNYERGIYIVQRNDQSSRARWRWRTKVVRWLMRYSAQQIQSRVLFDLFTKLKTVFLKSD